MPTEPATGSITFTTNPAAQTLGTVIALKQMASLGILTSPNRNFDAEALKVARLSMDELDRIGLPPAEATDLFSQWIRKTCGREGHPVFVGFNASFDWSFVNYYFHRYIGENPFGLAALDIKSLYMGATGCAWDETRSSRIVTRLKPKLKGTHDALQDARYQAEMFRLIRKIT
jgi:DNA polymerase III epsilon subunit-like protein